jgi:hypothetical protein
MCQALHPEFTPFHPFRTSVEKAELSPFLRRESGDPGALALPKIHHFDSSRAETCTLVSRVQVPSKGRKCSLELGKETEEQKAIG